MTRIARPLTAIAAAIVFATSLACSGLQDAAMDAAVQAIENDPDARKEFEKSFKQNFVDQCKKGGGGKAKKKMEDVCSCAADTVLKEKSVKELFEWAQDLQGEAAQKEMKRVIKGCM